MSTVMQTDTNHNDVIELDLNALHSETVSHLIALRDDATRLPEDTRGIRVLVGCAWASFGGRDYIVSAGRVLSIPNPHDGVIVSPMKGNLAVIELIA
jgi:hypothetical protein